MLACSSQTPAAALKILHKFELLGIQEIKPCFVSFKTKPFVLQTNMFDSYCKQHSKQVLDKTKIMNLYWRSLNKVSFCIKKCNAQIFFITFLLPKILAYILICINWSHLVYGLNFFKAVQNIRAKYPHLKGKYSGDLNTKLVRYWNDFWRPDYLVRFP